jgi:hypothetical protein
LERIAARTERLSGVRVDVYGFDTGQGLPKPLDYRDLPQLWGEGFYRMDVGRLQQRLERSRLILGPVAETVPRVLAESPPSPVGFVAFDLDMYSSTRDALALFDGDASVLLPRIVCCFDDIIGYSHSDFSGERLAISEFNDHHTMRKLSKIHGLRYVVQDKIWTEMMYMFHAFDHARYNDHDGSNPMREIPLQDGPEAT